ncbi:hypothetical protein DE146DRAFT_786657 [Phaeosphaeria sp. MPI-PUGE-AT-0046c]|nr:hypothetical protein DE146DRAFT_786657 [Phaeosphaeria sp. MPI-PUGE-AT-0046c]
MPAESFCQVPHRHSCSPFNGIASPAQLPDMYVQTPASTPDDMAFAPWLIEVPPYDTPLSRASSHSGSGYVATPQSLVGIEHSSLYHLEAQAILPSVNYTTRGSGFTNDPDFTCQHALENEGAFTQHVLTPPASWPMGDDWRGPPLPPIDLYNSTTNYGNYRARKSMLPTTRKPFDAKSPTVASMSDSDDSDYGYSCSTYSQRNQSGTRSSTTKDSASASVLKLGKWSMVADPFTQAPQRIYVCPLPEKSGPLSSQCDQRFVRPEHLRRHMKTVHGSLRPHLCKVPRCGRSFSRGDNLRDHYWTHIKRGGRIGKNQKMNLAELKEILGPKERKLIRKLKEKLHKQMLKQRVQRGCKL